MASKLTSLIPTNGTTFTGSLGRKIIFQLEPSYYDHQDLQ